MENEREHRLRELDEQYGAYMRATDGQPFYAHNVAWNYVLVEESFHERGTYYITMHPTPTAAAEYHDSSEYPDDWRIEFLVHAVSGQRYRAVQTTTFEEE